MQSRRENLRIGLLAADIVRSKTTSHGIANYTINLIRAIGDQLSDEHLIVYSNQEASAELLGLNKAVEVQSKPTPSSLLRRLYTDNVGVERWAASDDLDILHYPRGFVAARRTGRHRRVATLHDDIPIQYATRRWDSGSIFKWRYVARAIKRTLIVADRIVTVSQFSRAQLLGWCRQWDISAPPVTVIYQGIRVDRVADATKGRYILLFGSPLPHKRTALGLRLADAYLESRGLDLEIRVIGRVPDSYGSGSGRITSLGTGIPRPEVHRQMAQALTLVFPSEYEGFGLPPVEAFCLGTPSVFARSGVSLEVMGSIPTLFDGERQESFDRAMDIALSMTSATISMLGTGLARRFSTEKAAEATLNLYRELSLEDVGS